MKKLKKICACIMSLVIVGTSNGYSISNSFNRCSTINFVKAAQSKAEIQSRMISILYKNSGGSISCDFNGYVNTAGKHEGIDFTKSNGANVYSLIDGEVINVNNSSSLSTLAIYDAEHDTTVIYLHSNILVNTGDLIQRGQLVAKESNKGASAAHTHVEVRPGRKTLAAKSVNDYTLDNPDPYSYWETVLFGPSPVLQPDSRFSPFLSFIAYPSVTGNTDTYNSDCSSSKGGKVYSSDKCSITAVYTNGWCNVTYPGINDIPKDGFVPLSTFILDLSSNFAEVTAPKQITTFAKPGLTENIGYIDNGDKCYKLGVSGNSVQVLYPTVSGYKLGWTAAGDWVKPVPQTTDTRFNPYCPIKTYILSPNENKPVYNDSHNAQEGTVFYSDFSTIEEVYSDGWCKITYPAGNTTKTKQIQLSEIVYDINSQHVSYTATDKINVYTKYDMSSSPNWWISAGDNFFVVGKKDGNLQVMYPLDAGGYKLGWIPAGALPVTTYKISYNANGGSGAPAEQTKKYNEPVTISSTVPKREGCIFGGWGTSDKATSPSYVSGGNYTANSSIELYAIWNPVIYNISYDLNGGTGSIPLQSKTHGITSSLSKVVPEKKYTVIYVSELSENGLEKSVLSSCKFLGWSTSQTSAKAEYSAGGTFDLNKDTVLYAVWEPAQIGTLMDAPVKAGYSFDGWYTESINGKKVDSTLAINEDVFLYAHWTPNKYSIALNSNGGTVSVTSIQREYNSEYGSIEIPERDGYTFTGWYSDESCKNAVTSDTVVSTAADHKLYAGWTVNSYKVSFDAAGGECSELSTFANYNTTCELPVPVREGYTFAGWYKDKDYSEEFTGTTKVTADITVYAKWSAEAVSGTEIKGDVDKDGEITLKDIRILRQYYKDKTSIDIDMKVADLDEDGDVTLKDIRILRVIYRDL